MSALRSAAATPHGRGRDAGRLLCVAAVLAGLVGGAVWAAGSTYAWWNDSLTVDLGVVHTGSLEAAVSPPEAEHKYTYNRNVGFDADVDAAVTKVTITNTGSGRIDEITADGDAHDGLADVAVATWDVGDDGVCSVRDDVGSMPWNDWVSGTTLRGDRLPAGASASFCLQTRSAEPSSLSEHRLPSTVVLTGRTGGWTASAGVTIIHLWAAPKLVVDHEYCQPWLISGSSRIVSRWAKDEFDDVTDAVAVFSSPDLGIAILSNQDVPAMIGGGHHEPQGRFHLDVSRVLTALPIEPARRTPYEFVLEIVRVDDAGTRTVLARSQPIWLGWDEPSDDDPPESKGHVMTCEPSEGWGHESWSP